jgi:PAS domain S-box-containing protein
MIPLRLNRVVVGFVGLDRNTGDARFVNEDIALLHAAVHIIASALDRKQSEYIFRESENLYQIVLDAITDAVIVVDTGLTLLLANDAFIAWCEEHGLATNVVGKDIFTVLPFLPPSVRQQYERVVRTGRPLTSERSLRFGDQTVTLREMRIPIIEHGEVARIITVVRDITAQREVEDLRSKAYAQVERNMEQFALLADHIRNPLQAIMGRAELLDDAGATEKIDHRSARRTLGGVAQALHVLAEVLLRQSCRAPPCAELPSSARNGPGHLSIPAQPGVCGIMRYPGH